MPYYENGEPNTIYRVPDCFVRGHANAEEFPFIKDNTDNADFKLIINNVTFLVKLVNAKINAPLTGLYSINHNDMSKRKFVLVLEKKYEELEEIDKWLISKYNKLVKEVPRQAKVDGHGVHGHVRCQEHVARTSVDMSHVDVYAAVLEMQVGIYVDDGVFTYCHACVAGILHGKHARCPEVVGCVVASEEPYVATQLHTQYLGNTELEVQVGVDVYCRKRQNVLVGAMLEGDFVFPADEFPYKVLGQ